MFLSFFFIPLELREQVVQNFFLSLLLPYSALTPATDGAARIFSYHLMPWPGFELASVELYHDPGPFEEFSTN